MPGEPSVSRPRTRSVDELCAEFERAWQAGSAPRVESYLRDASPADHTQLLQQLLPMEWHWRIARGEPASAEEMLQRFPQHSALVQRWLAREASSGETSSISFAGEDAATTETFLMSELPTPPPPSSGASSPASGLIRQLTRCETFAGLPYDTLRAIAACLEERRFDAGECLVRQGAHGECLMLVQEGLVEIVLTEDQGRSRTINHVGPHQLLGEMSLLTQEPATATAIALAPTRVLTLAATALDELAQREPWLSIVLTHLVASRLGGPQGDVLLGKEFGGYRIVDRVACGGMSVVYEAIRSADQLRVALKMMSHRLVYDEQALQLFQREADLIEAFRHPHIVRMFRRFQAFHTYFIAMEYCDGEDLRSLLARRGALDEPQVRRILGQIAAAVSYSHRAGVVHRDIKPSNIMLATDGRVILVDFGLAKPSVDTELYARGGIVGTPRYMAPEQLAGLPVTERADYFSLGCVAYEMLTGRKVFPESNVTQIRVRHRDWIAPSLTTDFPAVSHELATMIERALQKNPADREIDLEEIAAWGS
uniref:Cyclic nucleotide-binding domain-containing protein n=1 Tax=Schlesneria paludicola TaxID=360056 RepID=A0A7C2JYF5_9PLAN